jgi:hypothetical protein
MSQEPIDQWVIYRYPLDFPEHFVARKHEILSGMHRPTSTFIKHKELEPLRKAMREKGLTPLLRSPSDELSILESWI